MGFLKNQWDDIKGNVKFWLISSAIAALAGTAVLSGLAAWVGMFVQQLIGIPTSPSRFYVVLSVLVFCAALLSTRFVFVLIDFARKNASRSFKILPPPSPPASIEKVVVPISKAQDQPKPIDLQGEILELYISPPTGIITPSLVYLVLKVRIVNHGPDEATITRIALRVTLPPECVSLSGPGFEDI